MGQKAGMELAILPRLYRPLKSELHPDPLRERIAAAVELCAVKMLDPALLEAIAEDKAAPRWETRRRPAGGPQAPRVKAQAGDAALPPSGHHVDLGHDRVAAAQVEPGEPRASISFPGPAVRTGSTRAPRPPRWLRHLGDATRAVAPRPRRA